MWRKIDSYPKTALTIGFFSGWLLDRKIIKYDEKSGTIIAKNPEKTSLTIVCADKKAIRFSDLKLYKAELSTKKFIQEKVQIV